MARYTPLTIRVADAPSVVATIAELRAERDSARTVAVRLEQENAQLRAALEVYAEGLATASTEPSGSAIATHQLLAAGQA